MNDKDIEEVIRWLNVGLFYSFVFEKEEKNMEIISIIRDALRELID